MVKGELPWRPAAGIASSPGSSGTPGRAAASPPAGPEAERVLAGPDDGPDDREAGADHVAPGHRVPSPQRPWQQPDGGALADDRRTGRRCDRVNVRVGGHPDHLEVLGSDDLAWVN